MVKNKLINIKNIISKVFYNIEKDRITEASAHCAYGVILSFIPFIIILLTLIQYIKVEPEQLINLISSIIPNNMEDLVTNIIREVYSKSIGTISISLIFLLFSADRAVFALSKELDVIFNHGESSNKNWLYLKIISIIKTLLFIIILAIGLVVLVFGKVIMTTIRHKLGIFADYSFEYKALTQVALVIIIFFAFLFIYKFLSGHKVKIREQIIGAAAASISLNIVSFIFSKYLEIFKGFSITYGSLTALMLVMMWIYSFFFILFIGAEINKEMKKK